ncbi:RNA-directed DNA polymerase (Reverse transcriptase), Ribonuclease H-like protein [Gossypium australe]|uniref:RNA-directed DNA polymerase (Reverse transcriptase), Ribonuclease H-like protein n=1 Tax=Gossypium australe TaxID=47621 RepID=A0A5B6V0H5_9ROSI|nr:RNA-directed DNA polymerase (Reverse transcriptase), Ribonuclease H-like protein [Gossypium australe]
MLSLKYESESVRGRELAWLLRKVKALSIRLQARLQKQLANVQQDMMEQIQESQQSMISQLTQLLARWIEKGKSTVVNSGDDNEDPTIPPGFTLVNVQAQPYTYTRRVPVTIRPQQHQVDTSTSVNYPAGLGFNPGDNLTNPIVPDLDDMEEMDRVRIELPKQLEDRCKWLEEKISAIENADYLYGVDAKELSLAFMKLYNHVIDMTPDRIMLQNMEKKQSKSFRQYTQRWREVATQVQPPLLEKETTMLFINTLKAPFINHMLRNSEEMPKKVRSYCEFHVEEGYEIQECTEFRALVQSLMDNKELELFEDVKGLEGEDVWASEEGSTDKVYKVNHLVMIISRPRSNEAGTQVAPIVIIQNPVAFSYKVEHKKEKTAKLESPVNEPVTENEAKEFLKFLKHSEYNCMVNNLSADNFIFFNDDEIPQKGMGSTKALHVSTRCKGYKLPEVLIDNSSSLNILLISILNRLPVYSSHMKRCQNIVRAFDSTERRVMRRIEIPLLIGNNILMPKISKTMRMSLQLTVGKRALPGRGHRKYLQGRVEVPMLMDKQDRFGLGYKPDVRQKKELEKKQERRRARLRETIYPEREMIEKEGSEGMLGNLSINATCEEEIGENLSGIRPYIPRSVLNNWTAEEIPVIFSTNLDMSLDIKDTKSEEIVSLGDKQEKKEVKIGACITAETKRDLIELLQEFKDVFAWSYQDMPGLSTDIVVKKQFDASFLQVVKYSEWVANIVLVPKKDGKVLMYVDYKDLNKASPKDNFPLPHIDTLVDNTTGYSLFSFMDGFFEYNQIKMHLKDMEKTTFVTIWGTFCYKVMPFGLKNAGATYQRAMITLFHYMIHKEIEVYVDDMIVKS